MRLLLDTHIFLWIATKDPRLSTRARRLISAADERFVSSASIWEAAIKAGLGKLDIDVGELIRAISASGIRELPVRAVHGAAVRDLPHHHRDPFDRLLVAQARHEPLRLVTADAHLARYDRSLVLTV
ncbi:type II toxin-antitoxin system VapC family toxin [Burkholderia cenocepacia]|uniref:type II toxin-antitoxin system VapC family toxin n=1 Tax=Burkholderia cenocepacia TaxID=95486 RepID=UPI00222E78A8|nr:type II toxin-antitoxin system VapC family toxin [Burkholderia cenocepacia]MCW3504434.1 type II toxin-antitoxin system VapC family toxin [Burkholderia cenocepacia]MCW3511896.1 type II toxin-antitoxin system VapC family toxin [Burkholderia cenocepacia]MCW3519543.1 type II toxin-antitoxin system VapC family toxin [Burkholderia cenocepacia]MCW3534901.1 type II toxin-antitoxin system VapC family toxin [Burkholderia cenocepacia]MCW3550083.1 type II toxin-antitoxin system VapC family toxin [Burkh